MINLNDFYNYDDYIVLKKIISNSELYLEFSKKNNIYINENIISRIKNFNIEKDILINIIQCIDKIQNESNVNTILSLINIKNRSADFDYLKGKISQNLLLSCIIKNIDFRLKRNEIFIDFIVNLEIYKKNKDKIDKEILLSFMNTDKKEKSIINFIDKINLNINNEIISCVLETYNFNLLKILINKFTLEQSFFLLNLMSDETFSKVFNSRKNTIEIVIDYFFIIKELFKNNDIIKKINEKELIIISKNIEILINRIYEGNTFQINNNFQLLKNKIDIKKVNFIDIEKIYFDLILYKNNLKNNTENIQIKKRKL